MDRSRFLPAAALLLSLLLPWGAAVPASASVEGGAGEARADGGDAADVDDGDARALIRLQISPEYMNDIYLQAAQAVSLKFEADVQPKIGRPMTDGERQRLVFFWDRKLRELMPYSALEDLLAPVVRKHLSPEEIGEMVRFYRTPTGRKVAALAPILVRESQSAGEVLGAKLADAERVRAIVAELREQFPQWFPEGAGPRGE